jgi:hypothetical protein
VSYIYIVHIYENIIRSSVPLCPRAAHALSAPNFMPPILYENFHTEGNLIYDLLAWQAARAPYLIIRFVFVVSAPFFKINNYNIYCWSSSSKSYAIQFAGYIIYWQQLYNRAIKPTTLLVIPSLQLAQMTWPWYI